MKTRSLDILAILGLLLLGFSLILGQSTSELKEVITPEQQQALVENITIDAWTGYVRHAWGQDYLRPLTRNKFHSFDQSGKTIVEAMSTLWVMGMREEFERGRKWIAEQFNVTEVLRDPAQGRKSHLYVGPLLSCYALTGDRLFLRKAQEIADQWNPENEEGINFGNGMIWEWPEKSGTPKAIQDRVINELLERNYLAGLTGKPKYMAKVEKFLKYLDDPNVLDYGGFYSRTHGYNHKIGERVLIEVKRHIQSNQSNKTQSSVQKYRQIVDEFLVDQVRNTGWTSSLQTSTYFKWPEVSKPHMLEDCHFAAVFSIGTHVWLKDMGWLNLTEKAKFKANKDMELAFDLLDTCADVPNASASGLPGTEFTIEKGNDWTIPDVLIPKGGYDLLPTLAESYFVLWRATHDQRYRDYAWQLVKAIDRHARVESGFASVLSVNQVPTEKLDHQSERFLGATLKYLYLIFSSDQLLPDDQWVFNAAGHPLPIFGQNRAYSSIVES